MPIPDPSKTKTDEEWDAAIRADYLVKTWFEGWGLVVVEKGPDRVPEEAVEGSFQVVGPTPGEADELRDLIWRANFKHDGDRDRALALLAAEREAREKVEEQRNLAITRAAQAEAVCADLQRERDQQTEFKHRANRRAEAAESRLAGLPEDFKAKFGYLANMHVADVLRWLEERAGKEKR